MADAEHRLDFLEGGGGVFFDVSLELCGVELAPFTPTLFRGERALLGGRQIPVNRAASQIKPAGRRGLGATRVEEFILIRFQDETNSGRVSAWQDPAGLIHRS
jgi:hypothetical protein